ncbi:MAG: DUF547 domain-containing protein [Gammaproteobacteria bacterium]
MLQLRSPWPALLLAGLLLLAVRGAAATDVRALNALIDGVFAAHVEDGYVDYPAVARNVRFHKYLEAIRDVDESAFAGDAERLAFWINAYNALAIKQITQGMSPIGTIARMKFFGSNDHEVAGRTWDLESITDDVLFEFDDPRVHFAVVNASYTAPMLRSGAYRAEELEQQLEQAAHRFVNDNRKNRFSNGLLRAKLSPIFEEYEDAFGGDDKAVQAFLARYIEDEETRRNLEAGRFELQYLDYDWSINGRPM